MRSEGKVIQVRFVPSTRSDLMCVVCGGFKSDLAIAYNSGSDDLGAFAGVHEKKCLAQLKAKRKKVST